MKLKRRKPLAKKKLRRGRVSLQAAADTAIDQALVEGAGRLYRPVKKPVTLRLDADVLMWFKGEGRGYQTRINRALRLVMMKEKKAAG
jgi:uncharacterized protein (DUF4415 family)